MMGRRRARARADPSLSFERTPETKRSTSTSIRPLRRRSIDGSSSSFPARVHLSSDGQRSTTCGGWEDIQVSSSDLFSPTLPFSLPSFLLFAPFLSHPSNTDSPPSSFHSLLASFSGTNSNPPSATSTPRKPNSRTRIRFGRTFDTCT